MMPGVGSREGTKEGKQQDSVVEGEDWTGRRKAVWDASWADKQSEVGPGCSWKK